MGLLLLLFLAFLLVLDHVTFSFLRQRLVQWARVVEWNMAIGPGSIELVRLKVEDVKPMTGKKSVLKLDHVPNIQRKC